MSTITRQPFALLNEARLQSLTSLKNRQNVISQSSPLKRKASDVTESYDLENVDPALFSKRAKGAAFKNSSVKPTHSLTKSASAKDLSITTSSPLKAATARSRTLSNTKSPSNLKTSITQSSPLSAPAGRSPPRGKRSGILSSRRRAGGSIARIDPPAFGLAPHSVAAPFSIDAALNGTIPNYASRKSASFSKKASSSLDFGGLHEPEMSSSWFFDIHEDTEEQEMTNLLQHSTCVLDISSDEESESRRQRERAEGKENFPPVDEVSPTSRPRAARFSAATDGMTIEKERSPLGEMDPKLYYSEGCDENSVIIVFGDEDEEIVVQNDFQPTPEIVVEPVESESEPDLVIEPVSAGKKLISAEDLLRQTDVPAPGAAVLAPIEGTGESFEVWESSSAKDEAEETTEI
ncbi:hypothetical protein GGS21DRAFT_536714 [Xylaria nigripes]|nr:hypothetical protein GGS21DRAFT_536714 [Xylaria nigripes]